MKYQVGDIIKWESGALSWMNLMNEDIEEYKKKYNIGIIVKANPKIDSTCHGEHRREFELIWDYQIKHISSNEIYFEVKSAIIEKINK